MYINYEDFSFAMHAAQRADSVQAAEAIIMLLAKMTGLDFELLYEYTNDNEWFSEQYEGDSLIELYKLIGEE